MSNWDWWHQNSGPTDYRIRELLRAIWDLHAMYGADEPWLWRGQANASYKLEPGVHTRLQATGTLTDQGVENLTASLIQAARRAQFDRHEGVVLPDMALLGLLQHHGAATPLLDVSLDPQLALYMAVVSPDSTDDERDGVLFAIKSSAQSRSVSEFDTRSFQDIYQSLSPDGVALYTAPSVSERLRIQRGLFLLGRISARDRRVTIPLSVEPRWPMKRSWVWQRMKKRGISGPVPAATHDIAAFRVPAKAKGEIRTWLEKRSGLTKDLVYPTPWHQPHLERFAASHGRRS